MVWLWPWTLAVVNVVVVVMNVLVINVVIVDVNVAVSLVGPGGHGPAPRTQAHMLLNTHWGGLPRGVVPALNLRKIPQITSCNRNGRSAIIKSSHAAWLHPASQSPPTSNEADATLTDSKDEDTRKSQTLQKALRSTLQ